MATLPLAVRRVVLLLAVVAILGLPIAALAQAPEAQTVPPPTAPAGAPAAPAHGGWLSPEGLNIALTFFIMVGMPFFVFVARRLGFKAAADKVESLQADAKALRGALVSTVQGVERFRKTTTFETGKALAATIEAASVDNKSENVLAAVVEAVTKPGGAPIPGPVTASVLGGADPIVAAVRSSTGRLANGKVDPASGAA